MHRSVTEHAACSKWRAERLITWQHRIWECENKLKTRVPLHCHWGSRSNAAAWSSGSGENTVCPRHTHISASGGRYSCKTRVKGEKTEQKKEIFAFEKANSWFHVLGFCAKSQWRALSKQRSGVTYNEFVRLGPDAGSVTIVKGNHQVGEPINWVWILFLGGW